MNNTMKNRKGDNEMSNTRKNREGDSKMNISKKAGKRFALGFPLGITIGYLITIVISLVWGGGYYSPCVPDLISAVGNEINAVLLQALLSGLLGGGFAAASVIWELESWSIVKRTGIYFLIASVLMLPIAYFLYWMEHSAAGFLRYFGIFALIFILIWAAEFLIGRYTVRKLNSRLHKIAEDR